MEKEKYYTPTIEEFHVGFEFETNNVSALPKEKQIWKQMIATPNIIGDIDYDLSTNSREGTYRNESIRVKYLDREDIESFGFEHDQTTKDGAVFYKGTLMDKNQWCLTVYNALLRFGCDYTEIGIVDINNNSDNDFHGTIKNKSELKKLLVQLGIK